MIQSVNACGLKASPGGLPGLIGGRGHETDMEMGRASSLTDEIVYEQELETGKTWGQRLPTENIGG